MKKILTDCDGVILNWESAFHEWITARGYDKIVHNTYDLSVAYGIQQHRAHDVVREFNNSAWMGWLKPFRDAQTGVAQLFDNGYRFHVITSLSNDPYAKQLRWINLDEQFGADTFDDLTCLDTGAEKHHELEPYRDSGLWWIEDKWENAVLGADMGLRSIIIDHPHNSMENDPRITRVTSWSEIVDLVLMDEMNHDAA